MFNTAASITAYLDTFQRNNWPLVIGEFGWQFAPGEVDHNTMLAEAQARGIGYLGWSWSGNTDPVLDMVLNFDPAQITTWGQRIINGTNGSPPPGSPPAGQGGAGATPPRLVDAVRTVAAGEALLAPTVTARLIDAFTRGPATRPVRPLPDLTGREVEVLTLVTRGLSNAEIEVALHISRGTLKTHIGRLLAKLDARDRAHLVIAGYEAGLAPPPGSPPPPGRASRG